MPRGPSNESLELGGPHPGEPRQAAEGEQKRKRNPSALGAAQKTPTTSECTFRTTRPSTVALSWPALICTGQKVLNYDRAAVINTVVPAEG